MQDDEGTAGAGRAEASGSVRIAIVIFLGTLLLLMVMGIIWMFVRVDASSVGGDAAAWVENPQIVCGTNVPVEAPAGKSIRDHV